MRSISVSPSSKYPQVEEHFHTKYMISLKLFATAIRKSMAANVFYYQPVETPFGNIFGCLRLTLLEQLKTNALILVREINLIPPTSLEVITNTIRQVEKEPGQI